MKCIKREIDRFIRCSNWVSLVTELASPDNFIMYALLSSLSLSFCRFSNDGLNKTTHFLIMLISLFFSLINKINVVCNDRKLTLLYFS